MPPAPKLLPSANKSPAYHNVSNNNSFQSFNIDGLTVIIPAYKASKFIDACISSIKNHENYMLKSSQEFEFDIYAGSGDFLNARGKMVITTDNTPVRKVSIYLQNKTDSKRKLRKTNKTRKNQ